MLIFTKNDFFNGIIKETFMVTKFMGAEFLITAVNSFYLPEDLISGIVSCSPTNQVVIATLIGVPMCTSP
jgi:uncharacterized membrane protein YraQ (UPF0718 family)